MKVPVYRFLLTLFAVLIVSLPLLASSRGIKIRETLQKNSGKSIGTYRALVIGINNYRDPDIPDLETAVNDANAIAATLKQFYSFTDLKVLLDNHANGSSIQRELRRLATKSRENDSVIIYYAGHGDLDKITKDGWWIPYDAKARDTFTYIDNSVIQKYVRAIPARHVLLVADSCFSGTLFGKARSLPSVIDDHYYATLFKEKSRWGMTSGNLTPVSDQGAEGHSIFAYYFIKSLKENQKPFLTPREIYQKIAPIISNNSEQMPITKPIRNADDRGGEFIFIRDRIKTIQNEQPTTAINAEETMWKAIENSRFIEDFEDYLSYYPNGRFAGTAMIRIRQLKRNQGHKEFAGGTFQTEETGNGTLEISSKPLNTIIYINNRYIGKTPLAIQHKQGKYTIKAEKPGYKSEVKTVEVNRNKRSRLTFLLDKIGGIIDIHSTPSSAKVYLNNDYQGIAPLTIKGLSEGNYQLVLKKDGYIDWKRPVFVQNNRKKEVKVRLEADKEAPEIDYTMRGIDGDLEIHTQGGGVNNAVLKSIVKSFEQIYPNVKVQLSIYDYEAYRSKIKSILSSDPPDIISWYAGNRMMSFVEKGLFEDVTEVWEFAGYNKYLKSTSSAMTINGNKWGVPYTYYHWGVFYRKDIFNQYGIAVPKTWSQFLSACSKLKQNGITPLTIGTKYLWTAAAIFDYINLRLNGYEVHNDLTNGKIKFTDHRIRDVFDRWDELVKPGFFIDNHSSMSWQEALTPMIQGRAAMYIMGNFAVHRLRSGGLSDSHLGFFRFPEITYGLPSAEDAPTDSFHIPTKAKNKRNARAFLAFIAQPEIQTEINKILGQIPVHSLSKTKNDEFLKAGFDVLTNADNVSQFYDRDTPAQMASEGMKAFRQYMLNPDQKEAILKRLDNLQRRYYK